MSDLPAEPNEQVQPPSDPAPFHEAPAELASARPDPLTLVIAHVLHRVLTYHGEGSENWIKESKDLADYLMDAINQALEEHPGYLPQE